jgi:Tol biopolymer transport system component
VVGCAHDKGDLSTSADEDPDAGEIWTMGKDGRNQRVVIWGGGICTHPFWPHDPSRILFARTDAVRKASRVFLADAGTGGHLVALTSGKHFDTAPEGSPDGKKIVFCRVVGPCVYEVWVQETFGKNLRKVGSGADPTWSLSRNPTTNRGQTAISGRRRPKWCQSQRPTPGFGIGSWSPDGTKIVCGSCAGDIWVMDAGGGGRRNLTQNASRAAAFEPDWWAPR